MKEAMPIHEVMLNYFHLIKTYAILKSNIFLNTPIEHFTYPVEKIVPP